jgi:hypothetical protein
MKERAG